MACFFDYPHVAARMKQLSCVCGPREIPIISLQPGCKKDSLPDNELVLQWTENGVEMLEASQDGQNIFELLTPIITKHMSLKYCGPVRFSKLTPIIQSKPLLRSHAPAIPLVHATDFNTHHHQPRSKTKPILKQDRGLRD
ncbi:hypothetical protein TNCV_2863601 [Trichonephila clavipes]|nr:hypothetical protein TNCV_2863601 [Trichonephila clavipes]